jgi:hypothetical protein
MVRILMVIAICSTLASAATLRSYHLGCSLTDGVGAIEWIAPAYGQDYYFARYTIPGAGLHVLWHQRAEIIKGQLSGSSWDIVACGAFPNGWELGIDADVKYADTFHTAALSKNPSCKLVFFGTWPDNDKPGTSWESRWESPDINNYMTKVFHEALVPAYRQKHPDRTCLLVPTAHVLDRLNKAIKSGRTKRFSSVFDVYEDGIHLNEFGAYIHVLTHYAVMFNADPHGGPTSGVMVPGQQHVTLDQEFVELAWDLVWETVTEMSDQTGVTGTVTNLRTISAGKSPTLAAGPAAGIFTIDGRKAAGLPIVDGRAAAGGYIISRDGLRGVRQIR